MLEVIGELLLIAVAIAIFPIPIIVAILILLTPRAHTNIFSYLAGWLVGIAPSLAHWPLVSSTQPNEPLPKVTLPGLAGSACSSASFSSFSASKNHPPVPLENTEWWHCSRCEQ